MTSTDLDPRFDPRYQRGYDAERHEPVAKTVVPEVVVSVPVAAASTDLDEDPAGDEAELDEFADGPVRRRNPYFIALIVLPVVLLTASAYLIAWYITEITRTFGSSSSVGYEVFVAVPLIAPALLLTGLASLIATLMLFALRRARRG